MTFPSMDWARALQDRCNSNANFRTASTWSDVKVVFAFGPHRYWFKFFRGRIIDLMDYQPLSNPLGYDIVVTGTVEAWNKIISKHNVLWQLVLTGEIAIDGNMLEANRMNEALCVIADEVMNQL